MKCFDSFIHIMNKIFSIAASVALIVAVTACALQVASRYIPFFKVLGMEELARMGFVWMVSLALCLCTAYRSHLRVDILANRIQEEKKPMYNILVDLLILIYLVLFFYWSCVKCIRVGHQVTNVFLIEMKWLYSALAIGSGGAILNTIHHICKSISAINKREMSGGVIK